MTANSLYPSYVQIGYHSAFGAHGMTIPTLQWLPTPNVGGSGAFETWAAGTIDAHDMINDLVELFAPFFKPDTTFDSYTIFTLDDPEASPQGRAAATLGIDGTSVQTAWSKAVQTTFSFKTDLFGQMKLVFLDAPSGGLFDKIDQFSTSPEAVAIFAYLNDDTNGFAGRDGGRIDVLSQIAYTLNEKLRREYGMN